MTIKKTDGKSDFASLQQRISDAFSEQPALTQALPPEAGGLEVEVPRFAKDLVQNNLAQFGGLFGQVQSKSRLRRVTNRDDLKKMVLDVLHPDFQRVDGLADAVTDYLDEVFNAR